MMAMSKEEQREAAERILEKEPLTEAEMDLMEFNERRPPYTENAQEELSDYRICRCGEKFMTLQIGEEKVTAMQQFADHLAVHQPTMAQWTTAYHMIRFGKE